MMSLEDCFIYVHCMTGRRAIQTLCVYKNMYLCVRQLFLCLSWIS